MRALVALLLIANLVFFGWSQGWLDQLVGVRAQGDREPERLERQVRPELVRILTPQAVAAAASAAQARLACLEAGPFDDAAIGAAESALSSVLPSGSWTRRAAATPARWMLRVEGVDPELAARVAGLRLDALGKGFAPCAGTS